MTLDMRHTGTLKKLISMNLYEEKYKIYQIK